VPRAYDIFKAYEVMEGRKIQIKKWKNRKIQYKIKYKTSKMCLKNKYSTISLPVKWEVCQKSTFLSLCLAKGAVGE
jgi:hypothetical protein